MMVQWPKQTPASTQIRLRKHAKKTLIDMFVSMHACVNACLHVSSNAGAETPPTEQSYSQPSLSLCLSLLQPSHVNKRTCLRKVKMQKKT